jgi:RNA polymerase sigma-70 factor (ECF subfamily)
MSVKHQYLADIEQLIIKGCVAGNRASQTKLYELYAPKMLVVCMRYAKNREEAEEILHEGFYRVFKYISQFQYKGSFEGWIRKIMVNSALQQYKSRCNIYPLMHLDLAEEDLPDNTDIASILNAKELIQLVQTLPAGCRLVFNLYVFEGFKHREIAEMVGISEGTSKSNLFDARVILQKALAGKKKMVIS